MPIINVLQLSRTQTRAVAVVDGVLQKLDDDPNGTGYKPLHGHPGNVALIEHILMPA